MKPIIFLIFIFANLSAWGQDYASFFNISGGGRGFAPEQIIKKYEQHETLVLRGADNTGDLAWRATLKYDHNLIGVIISADADIIIEGIQLRLDGSPHNEKGELFEPKNILVKQGQKYYLSGGRRIEARYRAYSAATKDFPVSQTTVLVKSYVMPARLTILDFSTVLVRYSDEYRNARDSSLERINSDNSKELENQIRTAMNYSRGAKSCKLIFQ